MFVPFPPQRGTGFFFAFLFLGFPSFFFFPLLRWQSCDTFVSQISIVASPLPTIRFPLHPPDLIGFMEEFPPLLFYFSHFFVPSCAQIGDPKTFPNGVDVPWVSGLLSFCK